GYRSKVAWWPRSYRPNLEFLETRLPLGDAFMGTLLGSWLIAPRLLADSRLWDNTADQLHGKGLIAPFFAESEGQNLGVAHFSFPDDPLGTIRRDATVTKANRDTAAEATGLALPDWTTLAPLTSSPARFAPASVWANGNSYRGQAAAFFEMQASDSGLAAI